MFKGGGVYGNCVGGCEEEGGEARVFGLEEGVGGQEGLMRTGGLGASGGGWCGSW